MHAKIERGIQADGDDVCKKKKEKRKWRRHRQTIHADNEREQRVRKSNRTPEEGFEYVVVSSFVRGFFIPVVLAEDEDQENQFL